MRPCFIKAKQCQVREYMTILPTTLEEAEAGGSQVQCHFGRVISKTK
jgi:hypothetical protein